MKEDFYSAVVDGLTTSVLLLSREYEVIYMNQSAEELFGVSYKRIVGMPVSNMLHIENDDVMTRMQENLERGQSWTEHECALSLLGGKEITGFMVLVRTKFNNVKTYHVFLCKNPPEKFQRLVP